MGGKVLATGECNASGRVSTSETRKHKTHSGVNQSCSQHAEAVMIHQLSKRLTVEKKRKMNRITVVNIRITRSGELLQSCCCLECAKLLNRMGIRKVIYSTDKGLFMKNTTMELVQSTKPSSGAGRYRIGK